MCFGSRLPTISSFVNHWASMLESCEMKAEGSPKAPGQIFNLNVRYSSFQFRMGKLKQQLH